MLFKKCGDNCALIRLCALICCNLFILMDFPIQNDKISMESSIMYFKVALSGQIISKVSPLKCQSQLQQTTNFETSFPIFDKNKV